MPGKDTMSFSHRDVYKRQIRNILYKKTKLEDTYGVNMLAIDDGRPETMNLKQILNTFLEFQYKNMTKKYNVLLEKELDKKEVQEGLIGACDVIDVIIAILREMCIRDRYRTATVKERAGG